MTKLVDVCTNLWTDINRNTANPQQYFVYYYDDNRGIKYTRETSDFDMRTYASAVTKALMGLNKGLVRQDWQNKLIQWVKRGKKSRHVYVLLRDSISRGEGTKDVRTFKNLKDAKVAMCTQFIAELNDWEKWCDPDYLMTECDEEMSRSIYEQGEYIMNHVDWTITACEVE